MRMVAAGECVEEQYGVALIGVEFAVCFVRQLHVGQGFTIVKRKIAQFEDVASDVLLHDQS